ncbi:unnamed protein product [Mytilus edulis]|uniref:Sushi domain-containing protein n=1 Tax=Mytilus edulis TaxID=6550 RepID=A0A8S3TN09_MYTED|nr:unnamed protein product [Mytilus edulis]
MTVSTKDKFVGDTGILDCSAGYSLVGNASITCLESGQWSPIRAICVPDDLRTSVHDFRGSKYTFVFTDKTIVEAKEYCLSMCGTLVEINNKEENQFIYSVLQERDFTTNSINIGLESRNGINFEWQSQNTTVSNMFDDWAVREPRFIEVDSCVYISVLKWYPARRDDCVFSPYPFICESR